MSEQNAPDGGIAIAADPFVLFGEWLQAAEKKEPNDPNAMAVATVNAAGMPDVRMMLLKGFDERGFVFYTNKQSAKGEELTANPRAALDFHWKSLKRQIRIMGTVSDVSDEEADAYFASRFKDSQIGAWASRQSRPMQTRFEFEKEIARYAVKYGLSKVPRPPHWSGYRVAPLRIEFWRDRPFRLHDRLVYIRDEIGAPWRTEKLYP
jgi:pyridoxamine 5'-phosphate oxidase